MSTNIIVIGAGAAGLMAARQLGQQGFQVTVVEAADRAGGRIRTIEGEGFPGPTETGAEFIHGSLPLTFSLLAEAGIGHTPVKGKMINIRKGKWGGEDLFGAYWDLLMQEMDKLTTDITLHDFLDKKFNDPKYEALRNGIRTFAEGYDLADLRKASTLALYQEWQAEEETEYRVDGGYQRMVEYLIAQSERHGARFIYNDAVTGIDWSAAVIGIQLASGQWLEADQCIITASLGVLQRKPAPIEFRPAAPGYQQAIDQLGFGTVIKVLMEFESPFWEPEASGLGFLLSDEEVPTWWLQASERDRLVTGWVAGEARRRFQALDGSDRADACIRSIAHIFGRDELFVRSQLTTIRIDDWTDVPYIWGGYSYETIGSEKARASLRQPLDGRIWFAGEALYEGPALATVEAALTSGNETAQKIIDSKK